MIHVQALVISHRHANHEGFVFEQKQCRVFILDMVSDRVLDIWTETSDFDVVWYQMSLSVINPFIFNLLSYAWLQGSWCLCPAVIVGEAGYTPDRSTVHNRAT